MRRHLLVLLPVQMHTSESDWLVTVVSEKSREFHVNCLYLIVNLSSLFYGTTLFLMPVAVCYKPLGKIVDQQSLFQLYISKECIKSYQIISK